MKNALGGFFCLFCMTIDAVSATQKPSILLIYTDDQTFDSIHALGNPEIQTPNLDRLARAGTSFANCYNLGGWHGAICVASRTMLNTGRMLVNAYQVEASLAEEAKARRFWSQQLHDAGYRTYMTGKWHLAGVAPSNVFDVVRLVRSGGMPPDTKAAYNRPNEGQEDLWKPDDPAQKGYWLGGRHWSEEQAEVVIDYLHEAARTPNQPFFIYAAFNAPHDPRQSPKAYVDRYPPEKIKIPENFQPQHPDAQAIGVPSTLRDEALAPTPRTPHAVQVHRAEYYAIITHLDAQIGRILDALEAAGLRDSTYIFLTADNGLSVGQHGLMGKQNMYEHSLKVPFIAVGKTIATNCVIQTPICLQDVVPTTFELAQITIPAHVEFTSLLPLFSGKEMPHYPLIACAYMDLQRMVRKGDFKLIYYPPLDRYQLFNLRDDPHELRDIYKDSANLPFVAELRAALVPAFLKKKP